MNIDAYAVIDNVRRIAAVCERAILESRPLVHEDELYFGSHLISFDIV